MLKTRAFSLALAIAVAFTVTGARHRAVAPQPPATVDLMRSIVIVDPPVIEGFTFERVLQTLIDRSGATATTPLSLYRQLFDTQNPKPGLAVANAPHCDDFIVDGKPSFNGFPRRCPTAEGVLATTDPFTANDYAPIGITNRFDLTPTDGSNCGQYRIIFAKTTVKEGDKLHFIFEPVLPNPNPALGAAGCRPVAQFWADLSKVDSMSERRARIERFFFDGIDGFPPVLSPANFAPGVGRIRTSQRGGSRLVMRFYQFHLVRDGSRLLATPGLLEGTPYPPLFNASVTTPLGDEFRQFFLSQVATLTIPDENGFFHRIPDKYLLVEAQPEDSIEGSDFRIAFGIAAVTPKGKTFWDAITAEATRAGSLLAPPLVVDRSWQQTCDGCHISGPTILIAPPGVSGTHIDEKLETIGGTTRFTMSGQLRTVFAPNRAKVLIDFLAGKSLPVHTNGTIGGPRTSD